ncbi:hypothetical protein [Streptomyces sp. NBC_01429]|uniref:hypothetical protein n=1 Tax=Streptomyces sp. NBC_01429 TaxID=2903862 RepID=UPI002E2B046F|nr:hypothetical protein [Streptomyces sp. NBC_01429]
MDFENSGRDAGLALKVSGVASEAISVSSGATTADSVISSSKEHSCVLRSRMGITRTNISFDHEEAGSVKSHDRAGMV